MECMCFVTGSRAYGHPRDDSDIDLVVCVDQSDAATLWQFGSTDTGCRFGMLNILTFGEGEFLKWKEVHDSLVARRPVTRDEAVAAFQAAGFVKYGVPDSEKTDFSELLAGELAEIESMTTER